jgi:dipeptidyl aminopeptidase/acylaminoacyl peptidase
METNLKELRSGARRFFECAFGLKRRHARRMFPFKCLLASTAALAALAAFNAGARPMTFDDLAAFHRVSDPQPSPDGRWLAYVVTDVDKPENRMNSDLWLVPTEGGEPRRLTTSPKHDRHPTWSPDGKWLAFESNRDGDFQVFVIPAGGGKARKLTTIATKATQPVWSPDGKHIAFISAVFPEFSDKPFAEADKLNKEKFDARTKSKVKARVITRLLYRHWDSWVDDKRQHLFIVPVKNGAAAGTPRNLTPGDRDAVPTSTTFASGDEFAWSPDGLDLVYTATPTPPREEAWRTDHNLFSVNVATGEWKQLTTNPAADGCPRFSPDGKWLAYRAQGRAGFEADRWQLMLRNRATGETQGLTADFDSSIESIAWATDSQSLVIEAEDKGTKPLWMLALPGGPAKPLVTGGASGEPVVTRSGQVIFTRNSLSAPAEILRVPLAGGSPQPVTRANAGPLAKLTLNAPESVTVVGAGGTPVQMWMLKPPGFDAAKKWPLVFWVHGGPQGASMDSWSYRWNAQLWAAQGYVIAMPNPRGSTGFGQKFTDEISGDWGGKVFEDLMAALAQLEKQPWIDTSRMAAAGASYGGYMMNWFQGHTDKFKTLITHCGVYNFDTMYGTTEELWFDEWDHGIPWENPKFSKYSPHRFAAKFKTPNLVIHNELDFRVPIAQGLDLFTVLQRKGIPSKLLYFPDEGHWVLKPQNAELWHRTIFEWLGEYLGK